MRRGPMIQHHDDMLHEERRTEVGAEAAEHILGHHPVVGMLARQALRQPHQVLAHGFTFAAEVSRVLGGASELAPDRKDRRFQDPTWKDNEFYLVANHDKNEESD